MPLQLQLDASHAIGQKVGGVFGVDRGVTSCVMLPAVMKWNSSVNAARQACILKAIQETGISGVFNRMDLRRSAGGLLKGYIRLGMPGRLTEVGVGREKWEFLAKETMTDPWTQTNPRKTNGPEELLEIFELAK